MPNTVYNHVFTAKELRELPTHEGPRMDLKIFGLLCRYVGNFDSSNLMRRGQYCMALIGVLQPVVYEKVIDTEYDAGLNDDRIPALFEHILKTHVEYPCH